MKILFVYNQFLPSIGGIEVLMLNIGKRLVGRGHDVTVLTSNAVKFTSASLEPEEDIEGIHVKRFKFLPFPYSSRMPTFITPGIAPYLVSTEADLMHAFSYHPTFLTNISCLIWSWLKKPLVITPIYNPIRRIHYDSLLARSLYGFFDEKIGIKILKKSDYIIALTKTEADFYNKHGITNVKVIPESVELDYSPSPREVHKFKEKHHLSGEVVISVGRIVKSKRLDLLIAAFAKVLEYFPHAKLLVIGADWGCLSNLREIVRTMGCGANVIFTGPVDDLELARAYESADVVVHSAEFETFARIALEAWSNKKPFICFDLGGPTDFITPEVGVLVKYGDINRMSEAIIKLLSDKKLSRSMGEKGYRLVKSRYSWRRIIDEIEEIYQITCRNYNSKIRN